MTAAADPAVRWRPNPYHIAALIRGDAGPPAGNPTVADPCGPFRALLEEAFGSPQDRLLVPAPDEQPTLLDLFEHEETFQREFPTVGDAIDSSLEVFPMPQRMQLQRSINYVKERYPNALDRVVPLLVPVANAGFEEEALPNELGYYELSEAPFLTRGAEYWEPVQGPWRDCWLIASLTAACWSAPTQFDALLSNTPLSPGTATCVRWRFADERRRREVEKDLPKSKDNSRKPLHAYSAALSEELWPALIEKAWAMRETNVASDRNKNLPTLKAYHRLVSPSHWPKTALARLLGVAYEEFPADLLMGRRDLLPTGYAAQVPIVATSRGSASNGVVVHGLASTHAYGVLGAVEHGGIVFVVLRDPHGTPYRTPPANLPFTQCRLTDSIGRSYAMTVGTHGLRVIPEQEFDSAFVSVSLPKKP